jgi:hypothetical protein
MADSRFRTVFEWLMLAMSAFASSQARADEPIRLVEEFPPGRQYHVSCRVELSGSLTLPADKAAASSRPLAVTGTSAIEYDERILRAAADTSVERTIRIYRRIEFERQVGDRIQESTIRPEVRRLVVLRHNNLEVPFSPDGPLTWGEMDLVRTDVFTPALLGLLGDKPVRIGERWQAARPAIQELTDMERIDDGQVECRFDEMTILAGRRLARVSFSGSVRGLNEDGPNRQEIQGYLFFDLESRHLSYLSLKGASYLLGADGKTRGRVEGQFVLTRRLLGPLGDLNEDVLKRLNVEPGEENTRMLYDNPELGLRFVYPRRWHVASVRGSQVALDGPGGDGILITREISRPPSPDQYLAEARSYLEKQQATISSVVQPRRLSAPPRGLEHFSFEINVSGRQELLDYYIVNQEAGGATMAARLLSADLVNMREDVVRIARSVEILKR